MQVENIFQQTTTSFVVAKTNTNCFQNAFSFILQVPDKSLLMMKIVVFQNIQCGPSKHRLLLLF